MLCDDHTTARLCRRHTRHGVEQRDGLLVECQLCEQTFQSNLGPTHKQTGKIPDIVSKRVLALRVVAAP